MLTLLLENRVYQNVINKEELLTLARSYKDEMIINLLEDFGSFQHRLEKIKYSGEIDKDLICPISRYIMNDPVTVSTTGQTYDRKSLIRAFQGFDTIMCPVTRISIHRRELQNATTYVIKSMIEKFVVAKEQEASKNTTVNYTPTFFGGVFDELFDTFINEVPIKQH